MPDTDDAAWMVRGKDATRMPGLEDSWQMPREADAGGRRWTPEKMPREEDAAQTPGTEDAARTPREENTAQMPASAE